MRHVMVVGQDKQIEEQLRRKEPSFEIKTVRWDEWGTDSNIQRWADVLVLDVDAAPERLQEANLDRATDRGRIPAILMLNRRQPSDRLLTYEKFLQRASADFVYRSSSRDELVLRIRSAIGKSAAHKRSSALTGSRQILRSTSFEAEAIRIPFLGPAVPEMRDPESGRLSASRAAAFFGLSLKTVADALGRKFSTVHKTPDAPSLQTGLHEFERMGAALLRLAGSAHNARIWLNMENAQLGGRTPLDLISHGEAAIVLEMLQDMLTGQPG